MTQSPNFLINRLTRCALQPPVIAHVGLLGKLAECICTFD